MQIHTFFAKMFWPCFNQLWSIWVKGIVIVANTWSKDKPEFINNCIVLFNNISQVQIYISWVKIDIQKIRLYKKEVPFPPLFAEKQKNGKRVPFIVDYVYLLFNRYNSFTFFAGISYVSKLTLSMYCTGIYK